MAGALDDIRIIDLSWQGPGPYCTMMLGDLGANVIRVQEPGISGRRAASAAATAIRAEDPKRTAYNSYDRNKKSVTLNLKHQGAREAFYKLAKKSDVLVEGYRPGVAKRLQIDYDTMKNINPRLVYCSISGYGQTGPYAQLVGHDINYISTAGALGIIGQKDGPPAIPVNLVADFGAGGMQAAFGILAALHAREKTGKGQCVDISLADGVFSLLAGVASGFFQSGIAPRRGEMLLNGAAPQYNVYQTKDNKWLSIGSLEPWLYENLCRALGHDEFVPLQNTEGEKREEIFRTFRQIFKTRTRDEWFNYLADKEVCVGKVYDFEEVPDDPQMKARDMILEVNHPTFGKIKQPGIPVKLSDTPGGIRTLAVTRGENTDATLKELGYSEKDITELKAAGAV